MAARKQKKTRLTPKQAQLEKDVKRINERINEIAKKLGAGSYAYNQWYATIKTLIPERYRTIDKEGLIKLKRSKEFYQTANTKRTKEAIARILGLKTSGQLRREAIQSLKEENALINKPDAVGIGSGTVPVPTPITPDNILQRQRDIDEIQTFVSSNRDMFYVASYNQNINDLIHIRGRRKTYAEMKQIVDAYTSGKASGTNKYIDVFEGL